MTSPRPEAGPPAAPETAARFAAAYAAHRAGRLADAQAGYRIVLARDPSHADAWHLLGGALIETGQHEEAERYIRQALALREEAIFLINLGKLLQHRGQVVEAEASYRRATELAPQNAEARQLLSMLLAERGRTDEALQAVQASVDASPADPSALRAMARVLAKKGDRAQAEAVLRRAVDLAPEAFETHFQLGLLLTDAGKLADAEAAYRRGIELKPAHAESYNGLGVVMQRMRRWDDAEAAFRTALDIKPDLAAAINGLGTVLRHRGKLPEAEAAFRRAMQLDPQHLWAYNNLGVLLHDSGRRDEAHEALVKALELKPDGADQRMNVGMTLLSAGRFKEGWPLYEARYEIGRQDDSLKPPELPFPRWRGEPLAGKSLLVWPEQGFGDIIQMARFVPQLRGQRPARLAWVCGKSLRPLLELVPGIDEVVDPKSQHTGHDYWCFAMSLPMHLGTTVQTIPGALPYLRAPADRIAPWRARLPRSGMKVGLVWKGSTGHGNDRHRSLPGLEALAPLWKVEGVQFISLQKGAGEDEARKPPAGQPVLALGHQLKDFGDTAAVISQLDLVIAVDTSVAHLAGAMGKPVWVMLPAFGSDWRWLMDREDSPWYPGVMRIFRHQGTRDWGSLVGRMRGELERFAKAWQPPAPFVITPSGPAEPRSGASPQVMKLFDRGNQLRQQGNAAEAEAAFRRAIATEPGHADLHFALANLLRSVGRIQEALASYRTAIQLSPGTARYHNNLGVVLRALGQPVDAEAAYRQAIAHEPGYADAHANLGNLLVATNRSDEAEAAYRDALSLRPQGLTASNGLGSLLRQSGRLEEAEKVFHAALDANPNSAETWNNLGITLQEARRLEESQAAYERALQLKPDFPFAANNLGTVLQRRGLRAEAARAFEHALRLAPGDAQATNNQATLLADEMRWKEAEAAYRRALALNPAYADAHNNLGGLLHITGRFGEAEKHLRRAVELKTDYPEAHLNLGSLLLALGRYQEGWPHYEARHSPRLVDASAYRPNLPYPQWRGEPLEGKSIVLWPEQGFGDSIQFVRYATELKARGAARVTMVCQPVLEPLLATATGVDAAIADLRTLEPHDYWTFALSIPQWTGTRVESIPAAIPYLGAKPALVKKWKAKLPKEGYKVGLAWQGSAGHKNDANRSLENLAALASLWSVPGVAFVSLQKGRGEEEALSPPPGQPITALGHLAGDFADMAAIVEGLDLVVTVDTAVAHLAGALGKPVGVLLPALGTDWRWLQDRADSPWYPGVMRLFRQKQAGDWRPVLQEVAAAIASAVGQQPGQPGRKRAGK